MFVFYLTLCLKMVAPLLYITINKKEKAMAAQIHKRHIEVHV